MADIEMALAALAVGAAAGGQDVVKAAVADAYGVLRERIGQVFRRVGGDEAVLDAVEAEPGSWHYVVRAELGRTGADRDAGVLAAARELLLVERDQRFAHVDLRDAKGGSGGRPQHAAQHVLIVMVATGRRQPGG